MHAVAKAIREEFIERKKRKEIDDKVKTPSIGMIKEYLKGNVFMIAVRDAPGPKLGPE